MEPAPQQEHRQATTLSSGTESSGTETSRSEKSQVNSPTAQIPAPWGQVAQTQGCAAGPGGGGGGRKRRSLRPHPWEPHPQSRGVACPLNTTLLRGTRGALTFSRVIFFLPQPSQVKGNLGQTWWCAWKRRGSRQSWGQASNAPEPQGGDGMRHGALQIQDLPSPGSRWGNTRRRSAPEPQEYCHPGARLADFLVVGDPSGQSTSETPDEMRSVGAPKSRALGCL